LTGNSIGKEFIVTCFGESHGRCVGVVVDGCPAGLPLSKHDIQKELDKRIPPKQAIVSARREKDIVDLLSGTFKGFTTGAPICVLVQNRDVLPEEYNLIQDTPRPGHADYPARIKYGCFNDYRGGGRFSGRITVALIMAGAIAKRLLSFFSVEVLAYTTVIGKVNLSETQTLKDVRRNTYKTAVRCPHLKSAKEMEKAILAAKAEGDSVGGIIECVVSNVPVGVGEPLFDSLDADIAKMIFGVPAVKGVEFGAGFRAASLKGSENNDFYVIQNGKVVTSTNHAGGILGGLSSGMPLLLRAAIKPTPSIAKEQKTVNLREAKETSIRIKGRHDPCIVPKAVPAIESAVALVLVDHMLRAGFIPRVLDVKK
jgi:chorismate synthase